MTVAAAALLGIIQGLTEFLPVSSSGHLILARALFGWDAGHLGLAFDVAVHVGTLVAVMWYFRGELVAMAGALPSLFTPRVRGPARLLRLVVVGTVPIVVAGLAYTDAVERTLRTPTVAAVALGVGGFALLIAEWRGRRVREEASLRTGEAVWLGVAQAVALVPGVSRSGITISVAMLFGLRREAAARFTFLLGVPAMAAAATKEAIAVGRADFDGHALTLFAVGTVASAVVGYLTVRYFIRFVTAHSLNGFAYYRLALAATALWLLVG